jgi:hypothetical protein
MPPNAVQSGKISLSTLTNPHSESSRNRWSFSVGNVLPRCSRIGGVRGGDALHTAIYLLVGAAKYGSKEFPAMRIRRPANGCYNLKTVAVLKQVTP